MFLVRIIDKFKILKNIEFKRLNRRLIIKNLKFNFLIIRVKF